MRRRALSAAGAVVDAVDTVDHVGPEEQADQAGQAGAMNRAPTLGDIGRAFEARATIAIKRSLLALPPF